jgi:hypothetical protein
MSCLKRRTKKMKGLKRREGGRKRRKERYRRVDSRKIKREVSR